MAKSGDCGARKSGHQVANETDGNYDWARSNHRYGYGIDKLLFA